MKTRDLSKEKLHYWIEDVCVKFTMRFTSCLQNLNKMLDLKSLKMLETYSTYNPVPLSIKDFMNFGQTATEEESFNFLRKEFPVRLSNIMKDILIAEVSAPMKSILITAMELALPSLEPAIESVLRD